MEYKKVGHEDVQTSDSLFGVGQNIYCFFFITPSTEEKLKNQITSAHRKRNNQLKEDRSSLC